MQKITNISSKLDKLSLSPSKAAKFGIKIAKDGISKVCKSNIRLKKELIFQS